MNQDEQALFGIDKLNVARSQIPAVTHVDCSARIQTVRADTNPPYHRLLSAFNERTEIEVLVAGNCLLQKERQDPAKKLDYKDAFELD